MYRRRERCVVCDLPLTARHKCPRSVLELYDKAEQLAEDETEVVDPELLHKLWEYSLIDSEDFEHRMDLLVQMERGY